MHVCHNLKKTCLSTVINCIYVKIGDTANLHLRHPLYNVYSEDTVVETKQEVLYGDNMQEEEKHLNAKKQLPDLAETTEGI